MQRCQNGHIFNIVPSIIPEFIYDGSGACLLCPGLRTKQHRNSTTVGRALAQTKTMQFAKSGTEAETKG